MDSITKEEIAQKMKKARAAAGLTQAKVANELGITYQAISNYERGKNRIDSNTLMKMCDLYGVDPKAILSGLYTCPACGFTYDSSDAEDVKIHAEHHAAFELAKEHFKVCLSLMETANIKSSSYDVLCSDSSSENEKYAAALDLIKCYFSRSLSANSYDLNHPDFEQYVSMILNNSAWEETFGKNVMDALVKKYGKSAGLSGKQTTYFSKENPPAISGEGKQKLRSVSRLESADISPEMDKSIADYIDFLLKKGDK